MTTDNQTMAQSSDIRVSQTGHSVTFHVSGVVDEHGSAALKTSFEGITVNGLDEVVFDFQNVSYIGSAGLGKLLLFYKKLSIENVNMRVNTVAGTVRDILMELKLNTLFTIN